MSSLKSQPFRIGPWQFVYLYLKCSRNIRSKLLMAPTYKDQILNLLSNWQLSQLNQMVLQRCKECMHLNKETICQPKFFLKLERKNLCKIYWPHVEHSSLRVFHQGFYHKQPYQHFYRRCIFFC